MALTLQEQRELTLLEAAEAQEEQAPQSGLSQDEIRELQILEAADAQGQQAQQSQGGMGQAALESFGQGLTLGHLPQAQAGAEGLVDKALSYVPGTAAHEAKQFDERFQAEGGQLPQEQSFIEKRDENIQRMEAQEQAFPVATTLGKVGGAVVSGIATGGAGAAAKGAGALAKVGSAVKTGATFGFLQNPGDKEGEFSPLQITDRLKNAKEGAITGAVFQGGLETLKPVAKAIRNAPNALKSYSEMKAFKSSGAMLKDFRKAFGNNKVKELGKTMLDNKIVTMGDDVTSIARKANILKSETGAKIGSIYKESDDIIAKLVDTNLGPRQRLALQKSAIDMENFSRIMKSELNRNVKGAGRTKIIGQVGKTLDELAEEGKDVSLVRLRELRSSIDDLIGFGKANRELSGVEKQLLNVRNRIQDIAKQRVKVVDKIKGGTRLKDLTDANKTFSNLAEINKIAQDRVARDSANAAFGLRERISGGVGATVGGMVGGVPGAIVGGTLGSISTKVAKQYGTPLVARTASRVAKALEGNSQAFGEFSEQLIKAAEQNTETFVKTIATLRNDPDFKRKLRKK